MMADQRTQIVISAKDETLAAFNSIRSNLVSMQTLVAGLAGTALVGMVKSAADFADEIGKAAQKVGVTTEELSRLKYAADLSDVSFEGLQTGIKKLSVNMLEAEQGSKSATEAFRLVGVSIKDAGGNMRSAEDIIADVADRFASMPDGVEKTALAVKLFGKSGAELIPLLNGGAESLKALGDEAERFGVVVTKESAKAAEEFNDNLTRLGTSLDGLKIKVGGPLVESLAKLTTELIDGANAAKGFWGALAGFTTSSGDVGQKLQETEDRLARLKKMRAELDPDKSFANKLNEAVFGDANTLDKQIAVAEQERATLQRLVDVRRSRALAAAGGGGVPAGGVETKPTTTGTGKKQKSLDREDLFLDDIALGKRQASDDVRELESNIRDLESAMKDLNDADADYLKNLTKSEQVTIDAAVADQKRAQALIESVEPWQRFNREVAEYADLMDKGLISTEQFSQLSREAQQEMLGYAEKTKKTNSLVAELGATFSSAFEDAILNGEKFSDVLAGIGKDIERLLLRRTVTDPLMKGIDSMLTNSGDDDWFSGLFGGFRASGGPVNVGKAYIVGERGPELFIPSMSGSIAPNIEGGGGSGGNTNIKVEIVNESGRQMQVRQAQPTVTPDGMMVRVFLEDMRRNGPMAQAIRGMA